MNLKVGFIFGAAFALDQVTKLFVRQNSAQLSEKPLRLLGNVIKITYVENPGMAFGIRVDNVILFMILSILASLGIMLYLFSHRNEGMAVKGSLALILGGAFGNLIDRILYKKVADFIDIGIDNLRWWTFNIADMAVVVGMVILFITVFLQGKKEKFIEQQSIQEN
jgi:signal peptidase II